MDQVIVIQDLDNMVLVIVEAEAILMDVQMGRAAEGLIIVADMLVGPVLLIQAILAQGLVLMAGAMILPEIMLEEAMEGMMLLAVMSAVRNFHRREILDHMEEVQEAGVTVVLGTLAVHIVEEVQEDTLEDPMVEVRREQLAGQQLVEIRVVRQPAEALAEEIAEVVAVEDLQYTPLIKIRVEY